MALNLNKGDKDANAAPGSTNTSKGFNLNKEPSESSPINDKESESDKGGKKNNFLIITIGLLLLAVGIIWGLNKNNNVDTIDKGEVTTTAEVNDVPASDTVSNPAASNVSDSVSNNGNDVSSATSSNGNNINANVAENNLASGGNSQIVSSQTINAGNSTPSPQISGSIDEMARKVINGEFGNGSNRKRLLGSEYAAVQAKVNELYRLGKQ